MYWPPLISILAPVMNAAFGDERKATASAISSGLPKRPTGIAEMIESMTSGLMDESIGVSMYPGEIVFTVMPFNANSRAKLLEKPKRAAFVAA